MNGEPRTDLIQLIAPTESLLGDDDLAPARPPLIRPRIEHRHAGEIEVSERVYRFRQP
jgi:hypothetical protein